MQAVFLSLALASTLASCQPRMTPVEVRGAMYLAHLSLDAACPPSSVFRVRKSSTISLKAKGAPYQPIKPLIGAWEISKRGSSVPASELWSLYTWRWEYNVAGRWQPVRSAP